MSPDAKAKLQATRARIAQKLDDHETTYSIRLTKDDAKTLIAGWVPWRVKVACQNVLAPLSKFIKRPK